MKIVGNTVGMGLPKPDLSQTDPSKGDFVKNKDKIQGTFIGDSTTPYTDYAKAYNEGKAVFHKVSHAGGHRNYLASMIGGGKGEFYCVADDGVVYYAVLENDVWTYGTKADKVFVGTNATTLEDFLTAYNSGKVCFMKRTRGGSGAETWIVTSINSSNAFFSIVTNTGSVQYGILSKDGTWTVKEKDVEENVFVGDANTTVAEYYEAYSSGKVCFMKRGGAGGALRTWVADYCTQNYAYFSHVHTYDGGVDYGTLTSDGTWTVKNVEVDLTGYATEEWVQKGYQPKGEYLLSSELPTVIDDALAQAKASGAFDGEPGKDGDDNVFIGDNSTTVAEFYEAFSSGKVCFLKTPVAGGVRTWVADNCGVDTARFYNINSHPSSGAIHYGTLDSRGIWTEQVLDSTINAVLYTKQNLNEDQQAQARENIGAVSLEDVENLLPPGGGGGGTIADWSENNENSAAYVKNRTHWIEGGETTDTIEWDGDLTDKKVVPLFFEEGMEQGVAFLSEATPTMDELEGAIVTYVTPESPDPAQITLQKDVNMSEAVIDGVSMISVETDNVALYIPSEDMILEGVPLSKGINAFYIAFGTSEEPATQAIVYVKSIVATAPIISTPETIHKLDNKFIDAEWLATSNRCNLDILLETHYNFEEGTEDLSSHVNFIDTVTVKVGDTVYVVLDGIEYKCTVFQFSGEFLGVPVTFLLAGNLNGTSNEPFLLILGAIDENGQSVSVCGVTAKADEMYGEHTIAIYAKGEVVVPLPEKYLPESVATKEYVDKTLENAGGGVTSWNDLTDKPFGETTVKGDTLTWDGNTEGRVLLEDVADAMEMSKICHISDEVITLEQLKNGLRYEIVYKMDTDPYILELSYEELAELQAGDTIVFEGNIFVAKDNTTIFGFTFPKAGIYMCWDDEEFAQASLTIPGYTGFTTTVVKPLDEQYMPILTSPSGKKFKLSVSDDGTLIATEVN